MRINIFFIIKFKLTPTVIFYLVNISNIFSIFTFNNEQDRVTQIKRNLKIILRLNFRAKVLSHFGFEIKVDNSMTIWEQHKSSNSKTE